MESNLILIREARRILNGESFDETEIVELAKSLKSRNGFAYAAQLYEKLTTIGKPEMRPFYYQQWVICTYKDPDLPSSVKLELAESLLSKTGDPLTSNDSEVLGIMGAIHKRRWIFDSQFKHLLFSRHFYQKGYENWKAKYIDPHDPTATKRIFNKRERENRDYDGGYTAINYAFLLDLMANVRTNETRKIDEGLPENVKDWQQKANKVRQEIVDYLDAEYLYQNPKGIEDKLDYWGYATLGEAYFGLGQFDKAVFFYKQYSEKEGLSSWQIETTVKQLLYLAQFYRIEENLADEYPEKKRKEEHNEMWQSGVLQCRWAISRPAEQGPTKDVPTDMNKKVGLGLSGGGFRASLYHIGTLAKLAELDVLRHVEAISCVSGGSIIGAYYYLLLRNKMMSKYDESYTYMHPAEKAERVLSQQDYLDIVEHLTTHFLAGVQKNLRMRILSSWKNLQIFLDRRYTRSQRLAELYEQYLYKPIFTGADGTGAYDEKTLLMQNLKIMPRGATTFNPKSDNWDRLNKVPMLVLNATTLNTGHNWQFTASWMGEPPGNILQSVDSKPRLRRMYYEEAPQPYTSNIRLGQAVGASSCVPALFEPLFLPGLYPNLDLRLVDGGVHDNQGIGSLIEQECNILILSDASGQLSMENTSGAGIVGSLSRSDAVFQERIRELQFTEIEARRDSNLLKGLMYIHLKRDLNKSPLKWEGCNDPTRRLWLTEAENPNSLLTQYGIQKSVQERLATLRTDLDAFNDAEAYALMYSAYRQTEWAFKESGLDKMLPPSAKGCTRNWAFFSVAPFMTDAPQKAPLEKRLEVGRNVPFKVLHIYGLLSSLRAIMVVAFVYGVYWLTRTHWGTIIPMPQLAVNTLILAGIGFGIDTFLGFSASKFTEIRSFFLKKALSAVSSLFVMAVFWIYLKVFNPLYLSWGKIENLKRTSRASKIVGRVLDFLF